MLDADASNRPSAAEALELLDSLLTELRGSLATPEASPADLLAMASRPRDLDGLDAGGAGAGAVGGSSAGSFSTGVSLTGVSLEPSAVYNQISVRDTLRFASAGQTDAAPMSSAYASPKNRSRHGQAATTLGLAAAQGSDALSPDVRNGSFSNRGSFSSRGGSFWGERYDTGEGAAGNGPLTVARMKKGLGPTGPGPAVASPRPAMPDAAAVEAVMVRIAGEVVPSLLQARAIGGTVYYCWVPSYFRCRFRTFQKFYDYVKASQDKVLREAGRASLAVYRRSPVCFPKTLAWSFAPPSLEKRILDRQPRFAALMRLLIELAQTTHSFAAYRTLLYRFLLENTDTGQLFP
jgi:hypothetical protein